MGAMARRSLLASALVCAPAWVLSGCSAPGRVEGSVTFAAGPPRSVYLGWATALAEQVRQVSPGLRVLVNRSSGSVDNLRRLARGEADIAVASADVAAVALTGEDPFTAPVDVTALARVYEDYVHLMVRDDSGLTDPTDLSGSRVAIGPPGSGTTVVARRVLEELRVAIEPYPLDVVEAGLGLQAMRLDAVFWLGGLPTRAVAELSERVRLRLLPLDAVADDLRARHRAAYRAATIPAGTYDRVEPVPTIAAANLLLARPATAGPVVDALLRTAFERRRVIAAAQPAGNALDRRAAISTAPVPLHPAAAAFYRRGKP
jgi:hypothetical protein